MTPRTAPLAPGDTLPTLHLVNPAGEQVRTPVDSTHHTLVYFMRTPTCPVCHSHLGHIERAHLGDEPLPERTVVVVPGSADDALAVEKRHPALTGRVYASTSAHEEMGLFVKAGLQQSGSFVVNPDGVVTWARTATVPLGSFNESEAIAALA